MTKAIITKIIITIIMRMRIKIGNRKSIEDEEIIMTVTKTIITKIIITIMTRMRMKIGNRIKI